MLAEKKETKKRVRIVCDCDGCNNPRELDCLGTMVCWHSRSYLGDKQPSCYQKTYMLNLAIEACPRLGDIADDWKNAACTKLYEKYDNDLEVTCKVVAEHIDNLTWAVLEKHYAILPLYIYEHSGITINTTGFSCMWDSGQVGWIYCSLEKARKEQLLQEDADWDTEVKYVDEMIPLREATERNMRCEVDIYDYYIRGEVFGYIVEECVSCDACDHECWEEIDSCWGFYGSNPTKNGMNFYLDDGLIELAKQAEIEYPSY